MSDANARKEEWKSGLRETVRRDFSAALTSGSLVSLRKSTDRALKHVSEIQDRLFDQAERVGHGRPACKEGCDYCCNIRVNCTAIEAVRIAQYALATMEPQEFEEFKASLIAYTAEFQPLGGAEYWETRRPCPMLGEGSCRVHAARPIACRMYHSYDVEACIDFFVRGGPAKIPKIEEVAEAMIPVSEGMAQATGGHLYDMHAAVLKCLEEGAIAKWMQGEPIFSGCEAKTR